MALEDQPGIERESTRDASKAFAVFTAIMVLVMIFPIYGLANKVEPMVLARIIHEKCVLNQSLARQRQSIPGAHS